MDEKAKYMLHDAVVVGGILTGLLIVASMFVAISWIRHHAETPCHTSDCPCHTKSEASDG